MRRVTLFINGTSKNGKVSQCGGVRGRRMTFFHRSYVSRYLTDAVCSSFILIKANILINYSPNIGLNVHVLFVFRL